MTKARSSDEREEKDEGRKMKPERWSPSESMCLTSRDSFGDLDVEGLLHLFLPVAQLRRVIAARHKFLRIIAAVFDPHILRRTQIPVHPVQTRRTRSPSDSPPADPDGIRDRDLHFVAGEILSPKR